MYGRDLLSRLIIGTRISLTIGFIAVFISLIIGIIIGGIGGYFGGEIDKVSCVANKRIFVYSNPFNGYCYYFGIRTRAFGRFLLQLD